MLEFAVGAIIAVWTGIKLFEFVYYGFGFNRPAEIDPAVGPITSEFDCD